MAISEYMIGVYHQVRIICNNFSLFFACSFFPYTPMMFSNQTDLTGKYNSHVITHCVIAQVR